MASCAQVESLAQAYVDGELSPSEVAVFEHHLGECRQCAYTLERQRATSDLLIDSFSEFRMARSLVPDVMAHLPEMEDSRLVRQMNERAKYQPNRTRYFFAVLTPLATIVLVVLALALFYSWPNPENVSGQAIGMVTFRSGSVKSLLPQAQDFQTVAFKAPIGREQIFETGAESTMVASIAGPNMIKLPENTRMRVNDDRRVGLESGKIWLHVSKSLNGARVFRVHTPDGSITVFGTTFGVEVLEGKTVVTLLEGEVTVENDVTFAVLRPNQQIELVQGVSPLSPYDVDAGRELAWANAIQPDSMAQAEFLSTIRPLGETILRAENFWRVDTGTHSVSSISFAWKATGTRSGLCGYAVYVTNDAREPLFVGRIEARDLSMQGRTQLEMPVPGDALLPHTTAFIRLVPETSTGSVQTDFTDVAFVGVSQ